MTNVKHIRIPAELLEKIAGGVIAHTRYKCPICGATEVREFDTGSTWSRGGDGWYDKCNKAMDITESWI